jgi:hypothetical protein
MLRHAVELTNAEVADLLGKKRVRKGVRYRYGDFRRLSETVVPGRSTTRSMSSAIG